MCSIRLPMRWRLALLMMMCSTLAPAFFLTTSPSVCHAAKLPRLSRKKDASSTTEASSNPVDGTPPSFPNDSSTAGSAAAEKLHETFLSHKDIFSSLEEAADHFAHDVAVAIDEAAAAAGEHSNWFLGYAASQLKVVYGQIKAVLLYKPPVGIVAVFVTLRLILTGRLFSILPRDSKSALEAAALQSEQSRRGERFIGRAYLLDKDDQLYNDMGGMDPVRRRLCSAALENLIEDDMDENDGPETALLKTLLGGLKTSFRPGSPRIHFVTEIVQNVVQPLSILEDVLAGNKFTTVNMKLQNISLPPLEAQRLLKVSYWTLQVRVMDALLRLCRDRLLKSSYRLARTREHWKRRVAGLHRMGRWLQKWLPNTVVEGDRLGLSYADAAYRAEVERLGKVTAILTQRPPDMDDSYLLRAVKASEQQKVADKRTELGKKPKRGSDVSILDRFLSNISKYSLRWNAEGKGRLSVRKLAATGLRGSPALTALMEASSTNEAWLSQAEDWTLKARRVICQVVMDSLKTSAPDVSYTEEDFADLQPWCEGKTVDDADTGKKRWIRVISYVDNLSSWRRIGEGKVVRIADSALVGFTRRLGTWTNKDKQCA